MKLQLKLFLFLASLLLAICLAVYLVPLYVAYRQQEAEREGYFRELSNEQERIWKANFDFVSGEMGRMAGDIDSFLIMVHGYPQAFPLFLSEKAWSAMLRLMSHTSDISYLQINRDPLPPVSVALLNFNHYWAYEEPINDRLSWVTISSRRWYDPLTWQTPWDIPEKLVQYTFIGVSLPSREEAAELDFVFEKEKELSYEYLLFWPKDLYSNPDRYKQLLADTSNLNPTIEDLLTQLVASQEYLSATFASQEELETAIASEQARVRLIKTEYSLEEGAVGVRTETDNEDVARTQFFISFISRKMRVRALNMAAGPAAYASMGSVWESPTDPTAAVAVARFEPGSQQGGAFFVSDIFLDEGAFDAVNYYKEHPPASGALPIAAGVGLVTPGRGGYVNQVNTMRFDVSLPQSRDYLSAGIALLSITQALQTITDLPTVLLSNGEPKDWSNLPADRREFLSRVKAQTFDQNHGFVTLGHEEYYYYRYQPLAQWDLFYLTFAPASEVRAPYALFEAQANRLRHRVSLTILWFAGGVFLVAVVILLWIARSFTRPLTQLAEVTENIGAGHFEKVRLPEPRGGSRNEVNLLTRSFGSMVEGLQERNKMRSVLDKVVSKEIAHEILKGNVELGGEVKELSVLFADIRGFTELSERMTPSETVTFINNFMTTMTQVIETHQGVIDKYIGDEIMALFGAPLALENSPSLAIQAALAMIDRLREWNREREKADEFPVEIGIGIQYGPMVAGNVGAQDRLNYTVIGQNVNIASSLCDIARPMEILAPKSMADLVPGIRYRSRGEVELPGVPQPIQICAIEGISHA